MLAYIAATVVTPGHKVQAEVLLKHQSLAVIALHCVQKCSPEPKLHLL